MSDRYTTLIDLNNTIEEKQVRSIVFGEKEDAGGYSSSVPISSFIFFLVVLMMCIFFLFCGCRAIQAGFKSKACKFFFYERGRNLPLQRRFMEQRNINQRRTSEDSGIERDVDYEIEDV